MLKSIIHITLLRIRLLSVFMFADCQTSVRVTEISSTSSPKDSSEPGYSIFDFVFILKSIAQKVFFKLRYCNFDFIKNSCKKSILTSLFDTTGFIVYTQNYCLIHNLNYKKVQSQMLCISAWKRCYYIDLWINIIMCQKRERLPGWQEKT